MRTPNSEMITRVDISAAGAGRFKVALSGELILASARDPEHEVARELLARGITGRLETYFNGTRSVVLDIEKAAQLSVSDGATRSMRLVPWRSFGEAAISDPRPSGDVTPLTPELAKAAV